MRNLQKIGNRYRYRKCIKGKTISIYYDHKPTQSEMLQDLTIKKDKDKPQFISLKEASGKFLSVKDQELSPSTYYGYRNYIANLIALYPRFMNRNVYEITNILLQEFVNSFSSSHKPKTTKNAYSLIVNIIKLYRENFEPKVLLPKNIKEEPYIPNDEDVEFLLSHTKDTEYDIPIKLGLMGLRMSEMLAITLDDINFDTGEIRINKAKVKSLAGDVIKSTKTQASIRTIRVDKEITDKIKKQGYVYSKKRTDIEKFLIKFHKIHNKKHFNYHKLRHRFASKMIDMGMPLTTVQKLGGWERGSTVLLKIYSHHLDDKTKEYQEMAIKSIPKV